MPGKRQAEWPSLWLLSLTAGILPYALRASFAVRPRSRRGRGHARESNSGAEGARKPFIRAKSIAHRVRSYRCGIDEVSEASRSWR